MRFVRLFLMLCLFLFVSCDEYELEEDACVFCRGTGYEYCNTCLNRGIRTCSLCEHGWEKCDFCNKKDGTSTDVPSDNLSCLQWIIVLY